MKLILCLILASLSSLASANVHDAYVRSKLAGDYQLTVSEFFFNDNITLQFAIDLAGKISVETTAVGTDDKVVDSAKLVWVRSTNGDLAGLPVVTVVLSTGSDEEWHDLQVRLSFREIDNGKLEMLVLDAIETNHEGPNQASEVNRRKVIVTKKDKAGVFQAIRGL